MTPTLIETLKTSIYNPKHTNKHENTFSKAQKTQESRKSIFPPPKKLRSTNQRFPRIFIGQISSPCKFC